MVKLIKTSTELRSERKSDGKIGFVPTMGNLHQGHISLLERALSDYQTIYFSIFVNPKQFGPNEDFNRYPRTLENDVKLIQKSALNFPNSKIIIFCPEDPQEIFPQDDNQTISVHGLSTDLEGKLRPGHFDGVATVVFRLFELIKPETAYFGLKDFQQYLVIRQMVKDLAMPINIQGMPIIREIEGLAMSSRNQYLSSDQRKASLIIYKTLREVEKKITSGLLNAQAFIDESLKDPNWDYLQMRDSETFSADIAKSKNITVLAVYRMGTTRLLDNIQVAI
jgi:pantoate--beta-alanine ligase